MFDTHVRQYRYLFDGLLMRTRKVYPNSYTLMGNYRPALCRRILAKDY